MVALTDLVRLAAHDARSLAGSHGAWMSWNVVLAAVPLLLAVVVFRHAGRRTVLWWAGAVAFVLFLPNAPYVLTDVIHLVDDIRLARSDLQIVVEIFPLYAVFFAVGTLCYVGALDQARNYARRAAPRLPWWPVELTLQALCAVGIYLGRAVRLNSWHVVTRPGTVLASVDDLTGRVPLAMISATLVVLLVVTFLGRAVLDAVAAAGRGAAQRLRRV